MQPLRNCLKQELRDRGYWNGSSSFPNKSEREKEWGDTLGEECDSHCWTACCGKGKGSFPLSSFLLMRERREERTGGGIGSLVRFHVQVLGFLPLYPQTLQHLIQWDVREPLQCAAYHLQYWFVLLCRVEKDFIRPACLSFTKLAMCNLI